MTPLRLFRQWRLITDLASQKRRAQRDLDNMLVGLEGKHYEITAEGMRWSLTISTQSPAALTVEALGTIQ
jgi:hypothetical protein